MVPEGIAALVVNGSLSLAVYFLAKQQVFPTGK
jgi:hypothetical protein